jgi:hypothetical protein
VSPYREIRVATGGGSCGSGRPTILILDAFEQGTAGTWRIDSIPLCVNGSFDLNRVAATLNHAYEIPGRRLHIGLLTTNGGSIHLAVFGRTN